MSNKFSILEKDAKAYLEYERTRSRDIPRFGAEDIVLIICILITGTTIWYGIGLFL